MIQKCLSEGPSSEGPCRSPKCWGNGWRKEPGDFSPALSGILHGLPTFGLSSTPLLQLHSFKKPQDPQWTPGLDRPERHSQGDKADRRGSAALEWTTGMTCG
jgi:hypothetical protein